MNGRATHEWQVGDVDVPAYLGAMGLDARTLTDGPPTLELLERLHRAHVATFPFGNVDVLLGDHPGVAPATTFDQLVARRRGGYCFEHAQLFAAALETLGYTVRRALGRVRSLQSPRTHMTVLVDLSGVRYLCDPGFGFSIAGPVPLRDGACRVDTGQTFAVGRVADEGWPLWSLTRNGRMEHVLDESTVHPADVRMGHLMTSTGDNSVFRHHLMVMRHTPQGHVTVTEHGVTERAAGQQTRQQELTAGEVVDRVRAVGVTLSEEVAGRLTSVVQDLRG